MEIIKNGLLSVIVCSDLSEEKTLEWVQACNPAGTTNNWQKIDYEKEPQCKPCQCSDKPSTHMHYMFGC